MLHRLRIPANVIYVQRKLDTSALIQVSIRFRSMSKMILYEEFSKEAESPNFWQIVPSMLAMVNTIKIHDNVIEEIVLLFNTPVSE